MGFFGNNTKVSRVQYDEVPLCFAQPGWFRPVVFEDLITFYPSGGVLIGNTMFPPKAPIDIRVEDNHVYRAPGSDLLKISACDANTYEFRCVTPRHWFDGKQGWFRLVPIGSTVLC